VKGWITLFYPYDTNDKKVTLNPLDKIYEMFNTSNSLMRHIRNIDQAKIPNGLTKTPFKWNYLGNEKNMKILAGFPGVEYHVDTGYISPAIGHAIYHDNNKDEKYSEFD